MKLILIFLCFFFFFIQKSKESMPENAESLNFSEIFKENIENKNNQEILDRFSTKLLAPGRTTKRSKHKYVKGKTEKQKKFYRYKFFIG